MHIIDLLTYILASTGRLLVKGLVPIGCLVILTGLFAPGLVRPTKWDSRRAICTTNLHSLAQGMKMYVDDHGAYPACPSRRDRRVAERGKQQLNQVELHSASQWVAALWPNYIKYREVFFCPHDSNRERNVTAVLVPGSATPFPVSYGINRMLVDPAAYGWKRQTSDASEQGRLDEKILLAECATAYGFDRETIAYLRYANYDPSRPPGDWGPVQFQAAGRVAWPDKVAKRMTRHEMGSLVMFVDGHVRLMRHTMIPDNDGPGSPGYRALTKALVPWE